MPMKKKSEKTKEVGYRVSLADVDKFFACQDVQRLINLSAKTRALQICFPREVNITRFLAWLLDPSQGHGFGDRALKSLLARAGEDSEGVRLPINVKRFLGAANVFTVGLSGAVVTYEVKVDRERSNHSLDVLCIDTESRIFVAIEVKHGAKQGAEQLRTYRINLENAFQATKLDGIHILLDSNDDTVPEDDSWIKVGLDWLTTFCVDCESLSSTAEDIKDTLRQFREAIAKEGDVFETATEYDHLINQIASKHPAALGAMRDRAQPKGGMADGFSAALSADVLRTTMADKAFLSLMKVYFRRPQVWNDCFALKDFGFVIAPLKKHFGSELRINVKQVRVDFTMDSWERWKEGSGKEFDQSPIKLSVVRKSEPGTKVQMYRVISIFDFRDLSDENEDSLRSIAEKLFKEIRKRKSPENRNICRPLLSKPMSEEEAYKLAEEHMKKLVAIL